MVNIRIQKLQIMKTRDLSFCRNISLLFHMVRIGVIIKYAYV